MRTTTASGSPRRLSRSRARPSMPAMRMSERTRSTASRSIAASAAGASSAVSATCPRLRMYFARSVRMFLSSSTIRIVAISSAARQLEHEAAPQPDLALEVDAPSVCLDDVADDRKPETRGPDLAAVGGLGEALEDLLALLGRDAGTRVADGEEYRGALRRRLAADAAAARRVAEGVGAQDGQGPGELRLVPGDREPFVRTSRLEPDALVPRLRLEDLEDARDDGTQIHVPTLERDADGARARQIEEA